MKTVMKVLMIAFMILGIAVSISNFFPVELNASSTKDGKYTYWPDGTIKNCEDIGKQCVIGEFIE